MEKEIINKNYPAFCEIVKDLELDFELSDSPRDLEFFLKKDLIKFISPFAKQDNGAIICFWDRDFGKDIDDTPIVYFPVRDKLNIVLAENFIQFTSLLPFGLFNIIRIFSVFRYYKQNPEDTISPFKKFSSKEVKKMIKELHKEYPDYKLLTENLKIIMGVEPHPDPVKFIGKSYNESVEFSAWLEGQ